MGLTLLLLLLPLLTSLLDASSENCRPVTGFGVNQLQHLEAPEGGSVRIPFSFYHPWELAESPAVNIVWRWQKFHGKFIYNHTQNQTHKKFKDRLLLEWTKDQAQGSLLIWKVRRKDATTYFCRVQLNTKRCGIQIFQSIQGTKLTVTPALSTTRGPTRTTATTRVATSTAATTRVATSTAATTRVNTSVNKTNRSSESLPPKSRNLSLEAVAGVAVASTVLIMAILGLVFYLRWKRSKGLEAEDTSPARASLQNTESKRGNMENKGHRTDAKLGPTDDGITYASLSLSQLKSPAEPSCHRPHKCPQEETLYSILKS